MKKCTIIIVLGLLQFNFDYLYSQTLPITTIIDKVILSNSTLTESSSFLARDWVELQPGFSFQPVNNSYFEANIQRDLALDVDYLTEIPNASDRTLDKSLGIGSLSSVFEVDALGNASYSIPLDIPKGTSGLEPQIVFNYLSGRTDGALGIGWEIGGLSVITRVPKNYYYDGTVEEVDFSFNDRFAIDGKRLLIDNGNYGANGTLYFTENEEFSRITFNGVSGNGPSWFKVETKNGLTYEYGNSSDSRVEFDDEDTPYMWRLNKIRDANGNYMIFRYFEVQGESQIKSIEYTGNSNGGLLPYNIIKFYYDKRDDGINFNRSGRSIPRTLLLRLVEIESNGKQFKSYSFNYINNPNTFLAKIVETNANGESRNATIINYGEESNESEVFTLQELNNNFNHCYYGDFSGDGLTDILATSKDQPNTFFYYKGAGEGFVEVNNGLLPNNIDIERTKIFDFDSDGLDDIVIGTNEQGVCSYRFHKSNGSGFVPELADVSNLYFSVDSLGHQMLPGDFDGNGIVDFLIKRQIPGQIPEWSLYSSSIGDDGQIDGINKISEGFIGTWGNNVEIQDMNSDGKSEILVLQDNVLKAYSYINNNMSLEYEISSIGEFADFGDVNGDNLLDVMTVWAIDINYNRTYHCRIGINLGGGHFSFNIEKTFRAKSGIEMAFNLRDLNGDKKADILGITKVQSTIKQDFIIQLSQCDGSFVEKNYTFDLDNVMLNPEYSIFDFNGDGIVDIISRDTANLYSVMFVLKGSANSGLATCISNGMDIKTFIDYKYLTDNSVYAKTESNSFPVQNLQESYRVVSSTRTFANNNEYSITDYFYEDLKFHLQGKGILGFSKVVETIHDKGIRTTRSFDIQNRYFEPYQTGIKLETINGQRISSKTYTWDFVNLGGNHYFPYASNILESNHLTNTNILTSFEFNENGNLTKTSIDAGNDGSIEKMIEYSNYINAGSYIANKPQCITTTFKHPDDPYKFVDKVFNVYNIAYGYLTKNIEHYQKAEGEIVTEYSDFDAFGNFRQRVVTSTGVETVSESFVYDPTGRFVNSHTTGLGTREFVYNELLGKVVSAKDESGLITSFTYNNWGELIRTLSPDGTYTAISKQWSNGTGPANTAFYTTHTGTGMTTEYHFFDQKGQVLQSSKTGPDGVLMVSTREYYSDGAIRRVTNSTGDLTSWQENEYYHDKRLKRVINSNGNITSYTYSGLTTNINENGRITLKTMDLFGNPSSITEPEPGGTITYKYKSNGRVSQIIGPTGTIEIQYNELGQRVKLIDPDAGTLEYLSDAFGRTKWQKDAKGNQYYIYYDQLGRLDYLQDNAGGIYDYYYVLNGNGKGQIQGISAPNGSTLSFEYDTYGRPVKSVEKIENDVELVFQYQYNYAGQLAKTTYPGGFEVSNIYDYNGNLTHVQSGADVLWSLADYTGKTYSYMLGNGMKTTKSLNNFGYLESIITSKGMVEAQKSIYEFNPVTGNLNSRRDLRAGLNLTETFEYDNLDRLKSWTTGSGVVNIDYDIDAKGNIDEKEDVGIYSYTSASAPHQITSIVNPTPGLAGLPVSNITYTDFNKVETISEGNKSLSIVYNAMFQRNKSILNDNGQITTTYYSGTYEKKILPNGDVKQYYYVPAGDGMAAVVIKTNENNPETYYIHKDHLGSFVCLTDKNGSIIEEQSFDPWGRRRNPANWSLDNVPVPTLLSRGFTGHEHLDGFGLINMNGRVYDPLLGMFLSPDILMQSPDKSQGLNRFTYCMNNPLKFTDPTGDIHTNEGDSRANFWYSVNMINQYFSQDVWGSGGDFSGSFEQMCRDIISGNFNIDDYESGVYYRDGSFASVVEWSTGDASDPNGSIYGFMCLSNGMSMYIVDGNGYAEGLYYVDIDGPNQFGNDFDGTWVLGQGTWGISPSITGAMAVVGGTIGGLEQGYNYSNHSVKYAQRINGKIRTPSVLTRANQMNATKMASSLKVVGQGVTALSIAASTYHFVNSDRSGNDYARLAGSLIITSTAAIPLVGPLISIGLGAADSYGAFDGIYNYFD